MKFNFSILKKSNFIFTFGSFILLIFGLSIVFHIENLRNFSGIVLVAFLPGYLINELFSLNKLLGLNAKIGFSISSSLVIMGLFFLLFRNDIAFSETNYIKVVFLIDLFLLTIYFIKERKNNNITSFNVDKKTFFYFFVGLIPFFLFAVRSISNPYINDLDGEKYIRIFNLIKNFHIDNSFLSGGRPAFAPLIIAINYVTGISLINLFKFVIPGLVWLSFLSVFAFKDLSKNKNSISTFFLLILLASPAFIGQVDRFKPETFTYLVSLPATLLFCIFIIKKSYIYYVIGFFYVLVASRMHDTGIILLLTYLSSILVMILLNFKKIKKYFSIKNLFIAFLVIFPYIILLHPFSIFKIILHAISIFQVNHLGFRLWFLNDYTSAGMKLSWSGWSFILFYLFNGIYVFALAIYLIYSFFKKNKVSMLMILPLMNFLIYLFISEILPRFGLYILPDRAWIQMFFNGFLLILSILFLIDIKTPRFFNNKIVLVILLINILCSVALSQYLATDSGGSASRAETKGIEKIKTLEDDAIIISNQKNNQTLVEFYGKKEFLNLDLYADIDKSTFLGFKTFLIKQMELGNVIHETDYDAKQIIRNNTESITTTYSYYDGGFYYAILSQKINQKISKDEKKIGEKIDIKTPIYLLYSYARDSGLGVKVGRPYLIDNADSMKEVIESSPRANVVYRDNSMIILKIN